MNCDLICRLVRSHLEVVLVMFVIPIIVNVSISSVFPHFLAQLQNNDIFLKKYQT